EATHHFQPVHRWRGRATDLERLNGCGDENEPVELELLDGVHRREQMSNVRWIEAPAEDPEAHASGHSRGRGRQRNIRDTSADAAHSVIADVLLSKLCTQLGGVLSISDRLVRLD